MKVQLAWNYMATVRSKHC